MKVNILGPILFVLIVGGLGSVLTISGLTSGGSDGISTAIFGVFLLVGVVVYCISTFRHQRVLRNSRDHKS